MKTRIFLFLLSVLPILASDISVRVEKGMSILRTWRDGAFVSEVKQSLTDVTNLFQSEKYVQESGDWTQKVSLAWYSGPGPMMLRQGWSLEWREGVVVSNGMNLELGTWSTFSSGGNQGAMTVVNGTERTQIINAAVLRAEWRTNGVVYTCSREDDQGTLILWYRTNAPVGLPWFVGASCELVPGERKSLKIGTPVDCVWRFMGIDKCVSCGDPCWLAGWPKPAAQKSILKGSSYGRSLQLSFLGAPGATYVLQQSFNLRDWSTSQAIVADDQGGVGPTLLSPAENSFFRVQAVSTATMNEAETAEALKEIREFNNQPQ